jgi:hypothetical protein
MKKTKKKERKTSMTTEKKECSKALVPATATNLMEEAMTFCSAVVHIQITNDAEYQKAANLTKRVQDYAKQLDEQRKETLKPHKENIDLINEKFKEPQTALDNLKTRLRDAVAAYMQTIERKRAEAQRKADEQARVERERLEAEAKAKNEEAAKLAAAGKMPEAVKTENQALAAQKVSELVTAPKVEQAAPKVSGLSYRDRFTAEVENKTVFVRFATTCDENTYFDMIEVNQSKLDKIVQQAKGKIFLPGIKIKVEKIPVFRT